MTDTLKNHYIAYDYYNFYDDQGISLDIFGDKKSSQWMVGYIIDLYL
ncbi:MAG: hypothetical protein K2X86_09555 [Cytophagaceae bacterium]|nr:hypothetical protein [Cytophagaceae bacterium]